MKARILILMGLIHLASYPIQIQAQDAIPAARNAIDSNNVQLELELAEWGMPVVTFLAQKEANVRDMGAHPNQILYWSRPLDHHNKILTPNDVVLYISAQIETFKGPMVLEVPAAEGPLGIFGSLVDPFMVPLEDVGGARGVDKGKGGRILITPPGYAGEVPAGYLHVPSAHYNTVAGLRITPVSFEAGDIDAAIRYIKKMRLYPLGDADKPTVFVDGGNKPYDPRPPYDHNFFRLLNEYVQTEAHKPIDAPFIEKLGRIGIAKGTSFNADDIHARVATELEEKLQADFRNVGAPFFPGTNWVLPIKPSEAETQFTYVDKDGNYDWKARAQTFHWAIWAPKHLGGDTFYLVGQKDAAGDVLQSTGTYELVVPPNVPAEKFWSVTVYEFETGGTFFDDVPRVAISSKNEDLVYNEDGSVTLTFGPRVPSGRPAANHVPTMGDGHWFTLFRWYGPQPALMPDAGDKRWVLGDFRRLPGSRMVGTRSGTLEFLSNGYPSQSTVAAVQAEMDYQRAVQAYLQLLPAVGMMQWRDGHQKLGGRPGDWIIYDTTPLKMPILTSNNTTPYVLTFVELTDTDGLLIVEVPEGPTGGLINDLWQRPVTDLGLAGPDKGKGGKYLIVLEGTPVPANHGADHVVVARTSTLMIGTRVLTTDKQEIKRLLEGHKVHALGATADNRVFQAPNADWEGWQPRGIEYWRVAHEAIQLNPVNERDKYMMQGLKNLGIERGKPFHPTVQQASTLKQAALVGETMAMANSFSKREPRRHWDTPGSQWQYILFMSDPLSQMNPNYGELDARAAYTYEAITTSVGMTADIVGVGSKYLASYKDDAGEWLDGEHTYQLTIPANVPIEQFWSIVLYDNDTRAMIVNDSGKPSVSSREELVVESDGSVVLIFGPEQPANASNWVQTNPHKGFFVYMRFYAPTEAFFDRSWKMGNIRQVD